MQKTGARKIKKSSASSRRVFFIFSLAVFRAEPQLPECLKEAISRYVCDTLSLKLELQEKGLPSTV